jgi:uncharacterized delta-60 repeat protein
LVSAATPPQVREDAGFSRLVRLRGTTPTSHALCRAVHQPVPTAEGHTGLHRTGAGTHADEWPAADTLPEPTVVDVMFLYTSQTVIGEGNEDGIRTRILDSVDETNRRLSNSVVNVRIQPVYVGLFNAAETGDLPRDLYRLANSVDGMERVPQLRNDYKADLVCLITELENQGYGGAAWDLTPPKGNPATGYAVVRRILLGRGSPYLPHELGHLLGCAHDREHSGDLDTEFFRTRKPYVFGHRLVAGGVTYTDLMAYEPGIALPFYSNPNLNFDGAPLGAPEGSALPSDGARTINETAPYVARYRTARSRIGFAQARIETHEQAGNVTVQLTRDGDLDTSTRVIVGFDAASTARPGPGQDYTRPNSTLVSFATNQATAELIIPMLPDEQVEGVESIRLSLSSVLGEHGIGLDRTCEIVIEDAATPLSHSQIEFPDNPFTVLESSSTASVQVRFTGAPVEPGQPSGLIPYRTVDGTALSGTDYQATSGFLTNGPDSSNWEIPIPILARPEAGADRTFNLIVGSRTNAVRILDEQRPGTFRSNPGLGLEADGAFNAYFRSDGKILVWGAFSRLRGKDRTTIALLNADGSLDDSFQPPEFLLGHIRTNLIGNAYLTSAKIQPDGRILVAGGFSRVGGLPRATLVRLLPTGALDDSFGQNLQFDGAVSDVAVQSDGRILVGGAFEHINGVRRPFIARLMPDGSVDESFQPNGGPTSNWTVIIISLALQDDGRILMGGLFEMVDGMPMTNFARLNPNGTLDTGFKLARGASGPVSRIRLQPDGKIVAGGVFDMLGGRTSKKLGRLNADGTIDASFRPPNPNGDVNDMVCLPDGRMLVSGTFTNIAAQPRRYVALLNRDGTLVPEFDPGTGTDVILGGTSVRADGSIFLTGTFGKFNGLPAPQIVHLSLGNLPPAIHGTRLSAGQLATTVHGLPGGVYPLEASSDLQVWEPAGEVRMEGYDHRAEFLAPTTSGLRFFRARLP